MFVSEEHGDVLEFTSNRPNIVLLISGYTVFFLRAIYRNL